MRKTPGPIQLKLESKLKTSLVPLHMELVNESQKHAGHLHHHEHKGGESHFALVMVSERFEGLPLRSRHQIVYDILRDELKSEVHALTQKLFTPSEWQKKQTAE